MAVKLGHGAGGVGSPFGGGTSEVTKAERSTITTALTSGGLFIILDTRKRHTNITYWFSP